jgi:hypothetical protein
MTADQWLPGDRGGVGLMVIAVILTDNGFMEIHIAKHHIAQFKYTQFMACQFDFN